MGRKIGRGGMGGKIRMGGKGGKIGRGRKIGMGGMGGKIGMGGIESVKIGMGGICRFLDNGLRSPKCQKGEKKLRGLVTKSQNLPKGPFS